MTPAKRSGAPAHEGRADRASAEFPAVPDSEVRRLVEFTHPDPHSILGAHVRAAGVVVRAWRPDAEAVTVLEDGGERIAMERVHPAGLFEAKVPGRPQVFRYRIEVRYPHGESFTLRDPYAVLPTVGELDVHLAGEGRHERLYEKLGAHFREIDGVAGVSFAVWAPAAASVSVVGDFNSWDGRLHLMRVLGSSGIWELFVPDLEPGQRYKFEIRPQSGGRLLKADPYAFATEVPPGTASLTARRQHRFEDAEWMARRADGEAHRRPLSIYEVHLGSWRSVPDEGGRPLTYRELAPALADYALEMGFTHVELLPVMEHPFGGSWGYQVSGYFAPSARFGTPDDFRYLVDYLHRRGVGVILDWVPAHFPRDEFALGRFDGSALYEHLDPRQGEHPDWGTLVFNYGRNEVRNFLLANALYWMSEFHVDGLRIDAVASMLYLDYSRKHGEWVPNPYGGRENLEAMSLLRQLNEIAHERFPGVLMIAEESTAWPGVSRPIYLGGLGFGFKWNMGWMHDTLDYFTRDPVYRKFHHDRLTFGLLYAFSENFVLPFSHDEVVHGKGSMLDKMPGDRWQKFANLRSLYAYMWAHPGKKLLFMGCEFGQWREWNHNHSLDWHLLGGVEHLGLQSLVRDLNHLYRERPALWHEDSEPSGFQWIDGSNSHDNVISFLRRDSRSGAAVICVCNFSPVVRHGYRVGLPRPGHYRELLNTDAQLYAGSNVGNAGGVEAQAVPWHGQPASAEITLPPLATVWFEAPPA